MTEGMTLSTRDFTPPNIQFTGSTISEEQLVSTFRPGLNRMLSRITGDDARAEDLTHETLMLVLQKLRGEGLREPDKLASFVYQTAKYLHLGWYRKRSNQEVLWGQVEYHVDNGMGIEQTLIMQEQCKILKNLIDGLSLERDRQILTRFYMHEQTKDEICDALHLNRDHFDRVISRARKRLKDSIVPNEEAPAFRP